MFKEKLQPFIKRHNEITELLSSPDIASDISRMTKLSKEQSGLNDLVEKAKLYIETADSIEENKELLGDAELKIFYLNSEQGQEEMKQHFLLPMFSVCIHVTPNRQDGK